MLGASGRRRGSRRAASGRGGEENGAPRAAQGAERGIRRAGGDPGKKLPDGWEFRDVAAGRDLDDPLRGFADERGLAEERGYDLAESYSYSDSHTDLPMLDIVGHPFAEKEHIPGLRHDPDGPVLLLPGSRPKPVRKIFPALVEAFALFRQSHPKRRALVLHTGGEVHAELYRLLAEYGEQAKGIDLRPVSEGPAAGCAALVSSGTMSLPVALAGIPGAVVYRANPLTWVMGRYLIAGRVDHLGIANILLKRQAWPEYLQGACEPGALAARLRACVEGPELRTQAVADASELHALLSAKSGSTPAEWVASHLPKEVRP